MPDLRGLFLTSSAPEETARFYREVAGVPMETVTAEGGYVYWKASQADVQIAVHHAEAFAAYADPPVPASNLTHLYFSVKDLTVFARELAAAGLTPVAQDSHTITVRDPDGRHVLFGDVS